MRQRALRAAGGQHGVNKRAKHNQYQHRNGLTVTHDDNPNGKAKSERACDRGSPVLPDG